MKNKPSQPERWRVLAFSFSLSCLLIQVSCSMYARRDEEIRMIKKYDSEIELVNRKIDSLDAKPNAATPSPRSWTRDSLLAVRGTLEEDRKYWQLRAGKEVQKDWDSRKPCMEAPNNCPPNKTSQRK